MTREPITNTSTRYFYTDPLAAAWMTAHHGMKLYIPQHRWFKGKEWTDFTIGAVGLCHEVVEEDKCNGRHDRYYIHPDSLHLLAPQEGDLVAWSHEGYLTHQEGKTPCTVGGIGTFPVQRLDAVTEGEQAATVIQRNGAAFHWPESEAV